MFAAAFRALVLRELDAAWDEISPLLRARLARFLMALATLIMAGSVGAAVVAVRLDVPVTRDLTGTVARTVELEVDPPLATAIDICLLPGELRLFIDKHFELHTYENRGQQNEIHYVLTFQPETLSTSTGPVAVEVFRTGQAPEIRVDPMSPELRNCLARKTVNEVTTR